MIGRGRPGADASGVTLPAFGGHAFDDRQIEGGRAATRYCISFRINDSDILSQPANARLGPTA
jgi:hypothetical protein